MDLYYFNEENSQIPLADFKFFSFLLNALFRIKNDVVLKKKSQKNKAKRVSAEKKCCSVMFCILIRNCKNCGM